ncbi:MAG: protein kinase [Prevotellaceae bacterium]|nr:protein kinase [Prevotellaceae bacterium]
MKEIVNGLPVGTELQGRAYRYRIEGALGQGSFGITYRATVKMQGPLGALDVNVAVKEFFMHERNGRSGTTVTLGSDPTIDRRYRVKFIDEAMKLSKMEHPNIVRVMETFEANNTVYYSMEYISGGSLDDYILQRGRLGEQECVGFAREIGAALQDMHSKGMLHLDLKPSNIMVRDGHAVLIDFGLSKQYDANGKPETSTSVGGGTQGYAPLEQIDYHDGKDFPVTMDVYALGGTMFKMLAGRTPPYASEVFNQGFPSGELRKAGVSPWLVSLIERCMRPRKAERIQTVAEVLRVIEANASDVIMGELVSTNYGFYKKYTGEREYGTLKLTKVPVTDPLPFPDSEILIDYSPNDNKGFSYMIAFNMSSPYEGILRIRQGNTVIVERDDVPTGIPDEVRSYIVSHGFLSKVHWEKEETTIPLARDYGVNLCVAFSYKGKERFLRRVEHAHKEGHRLLLDEVEGLIGLLQRCKVIPDKKEIERAYRATTEGFPLALPDDVEKVEISYTPQSPNFNGSYKVNLTPNEIKAECLVNGSDVNVGKVILKQRYKAILTAITNLHIPIRGEEIPYLMEYSEDPPTLSLSLYKKGSLVGKYWIKGDFGAKVYGNIIGDLYNIKESIENAVPELKACLRRAAEEEKKRRAKEESMQRPADELRRKPRKKARIVLCVLAVLLILCAVFGVARYRVLRNRVSPATGTINGHGYVDLGLSVKWATCNVGASSPEEYGDYYAWGETSTKSDYSSSTCKTWEVSMSSIAGDPNYDAARANWRGTWRLPTKSEIDELKDECEWRYIKKNGHEGYKVTGPNGNSIFLPAAGHCLWTSLYWDGDHGYYWSATPDESDTRDAYELDICSLYSSQCDASRSNGLSVRAVSD